MRMDDGVEVVASKSWVYGTVCSDVEGLLSLRHTLLCAADRRILKEGAVCVSLGEVLEKTRYCCRNMCLVSVVLCLPYIKFLVVKMVVTEI